MRFAIIIVLVIAGCEQSLIRYSTEDPNIPIEYKGKAAETMAKIMAAKEKTAHTMRYELVGSLTPYYSILFLIGLAGLAACIFMRYLKVPVGRFFWIVPVVCFIGMALIHSFAEFAQYISWIAAGLALIIFVWKIVEWKWERNQK